MRIQRPRALLAFVSLALGLGSIAGKALSYRDETRVAGIAREMALSGDYAVPRLNGAPFLEYPSLGYLPDAFLFRVFGDLSDFWTLLPYPLWGLGTVLITFSIGRRLGGASVGLAAGLALQTTLGFLNLHNRALVDPALLFWVTFSMLGLLRALQEGGWRGWAMFHLGMAGGFLSKGLLGVAVPGGTALIYLAVGREWRQLFDARAAASVSFLVAPILLWSWGVYASGGPELVGEVWRESIHRFTSSEADHRQPFYFYLEVAPYYLAPWFVLLPILVWRLPHWQGTARLPAIWFGVVLLGLSAASAKRNLYLGPLFPAIPLWAALWWKEVRAGHFRSPVEDWLARALPRAGPALAGLFVAAIAATHVLHDVPRSRRESLRPFLERVAAERAATPLYLLDPSLSLKGAAALYLGEVLPNLSGTEEIARAVAKSSSEILLAGDRIADRLPGDSPAWTAEVVVEMPVGRRGRRTMQLYRVRP